MGENRNFKIEFIFVQLFLDFLQNWALKTRKYSLTKKKILSLKNSDFQKRTNDLNEN